MGRLGPGLITGAADDDPGGIATHSQAGAAFGFNMLWTVVLAYPLLAGIQSVVARIGRVTGHGLSANVKRVFPRWVLATLVAMLLAANTINIAADIAVMGEAANLIAPGPGVHQVIHLKPSTRKTSRQMTAATRSADRIHPGSGASPPAVQGTPILA